MPGDKDTTSPDDSASDAAPPEALDAALLALHKIEKVSDYKHKIYAKRNVASMGALDFGFGVQSADTMPALAPSASQRATTNLATLAERKILELFGPPGVVVNEDLDVVHIRGRTGPFLEPMPGAPSFNILRLARPDLHVELRRALHEAKATGARVSADCQIVEDGGLRRVVIEVEPKRELAPSAPGGDGVDQSNGDQRQQELERELSGHEGVPAEHDRGAGECQRGAEVVERGVAIVQRRATEHERGARNLEGRAAIVQ
jgi:hypothetical protein